MYESNSPLPSARQVRVDIPAEAHDRNVRQAVLALAPRLALYVGSILAIIATPWWAWPPLVFLAGLATSLLFVVAHDGAHDSLTQYPTLNGWIARVLFVPAWHNCSGWIHAHNHVHHGWTNFQPKDYVWSPLSLAQYRALSPLGQWWFRLCRRWPAFGLYYGVEIWGKKILLPRPEVRQARVRQRWHLDNLVLVGGVIASSVMTLGVARAWGVTTPPLALWVGTQLLPALVCWWFVGFLTYLHHTHPAIPWFQDQRQWSFYMGQICSTTHVHFPGAINDLIGNIMEHTAHHVDQRIPLYHLRSVQEHLERLHQLVISVFGIRSFLYTQRVCQLYDFDQHCWTNYQGQRTSARTVSEALLERALRSSESRAVEMA